MDFTHTTGLLALGLFCGMLACLEFGRWLGRRWATRNPDEAKSRAAATLESAVFGLMALLIAFSFGGASSRFDLRRHLIVEETNAIGTAWLRLDMLPSSAQPGMRALFRQYVDARLEVYERLPDVKAASAAMEQSVKLQNDIWSAAVAACRSEEGQRVAILVLPALNNLIDITTTRTMAAKTHPPMIIFVLMFGLALGSMVLAGYDHAQAQGRSWIHIIAFAALLTVTVYIIIDLEFPRLGLIRVDAFDDVLVGLRQSMG